MATDKVNFTSSILSDMTAKAAMFHNNKQPEQESTTAVQNPQTIIAQPETISRVFYYDSKRNPIKLECLDDAGKVIKERYSVNGNELDVYYTP